VEDSVFASVFSFVSAVAGEFPLYAIIVTIVCSMNKTKKKKKKMLGLQRCLLLSSLVDRKLPLHVSGVSFSELHHSLQ
jgi:hypothetical protein